MAENSKAGRQTTGGFTLLELLVVIALTTIILGLLFGPIFQAFSINRRTQAITVAQDVTRFGLEQMVRELSQAAFVYDNTRTPIILPIGEKPGVDFPAPPANYNRYRPPFLFAKIDFVPAATQPLKEGEVEDPTTGGRYGGTDLRFPLARARRVVRYWIGLRDNTNVYQNVYEFPRSDNGLNPFVLWRAEFEPNDPNLIFQQAFDSVEPREGGFDDPDFFYNVDRRGPNGRTFAQNWRAIASPLISGDRLDLLAWNRTSDRGVSASNPFRTTVSFSPATVVGDTATPGYLTDLGNEAPNAVPSVYTTKNGQWVLPYTVTFYRGTTRNPNNATPSFLRIRVGPDQNNLIRPVLVNAPSGTDLVYGRSQRGWFISAGGADGVTFSLDPLRGRVVTGFPPLATNGNGVPLINDDRSSPSFGEPIPIVFRVNSRHPDAGRELPANTGRSELDLTEPNYVGPDRREDHPSPFAQFGGLIVPGSERVLGPDNNPSRDSTPGDPELVPYHRVPVLPSGRQDAKIEVDPATGTSLFSGYSTGPLVYELGLNPAQPVIFFDKSIIPTPPPQGLPAVPESEPQERQKFVEVTYLWQNNYARGTAGGDDAPEADVVKVDYSTRSLLNINLGVRVYDANRGRPQMVQLTDQVKINNVGR